MHKLFSLSKEAGIHHYVVRKSFNTEAAQDQTIRNSGFSVILLYASCNTNADVLI
ncbi:rCG36980 [Rattus norvegicus]|uniref:RCG36980 n=1 Tax=Rattus norvegicus TaxID=10116 RepID=A6HU80_RAT|nr:rCG36980 [Rattus norvegicus]